MTKRRINHQQAARIKKNQQALQTLPEVGEDASHVQGLVISRFGRHAEIEGPLGQRLHCSIRANLESLVAGDKVIWAPLEAGRGVVLSLCPRQSVMTRVDKRKTEKPLAANITQLIIVLAVKPEPSFGLLDSYLIMAECLHLQATIVLNKVDLEHQAVKAELLHCYQPLGYSIVYCSEHSLEGHQALVQALQGQSSVFVGQSGVGKSSLIAKILPEEQKIQVGEISAQSELGCHTTSNSRLYHLPQGGNVIDSPGIREWGLSQMPAHDIFYGFREFRNLDSPCQFRNCNHVDSPGCALMDAVKAGKISAKRYQSYLKLSAEEALHKRCSPRHSG